MKAKEPKFKLGPIQRAWVKALRSGKYKQTKNYLTTLKDGKPHRYCCLGILCEMAVNSGLGIKVEPFTETDVPRLAYDKERAILSRKVRKWAGLKRVSGDYSQHECLAGHNDAGKSFKKIVDIIEKHAAEIFTEAK